MLERRQLGHYRLIQRIGGGGMGEIYLAQDIRIERQVALKMVRAEVDPYPDAVAASDQQRLFMREMQAISRLDHPNILPLYDFGEERADNQSITFMVMPYRPEGSLTDWLQRRGSNARLSFQDVANFIKQASEALQHAHDHSLVHQDVKPSNFLVRDHPGYPLPDLLLSDFGIARILSATSTASQSVRGTPTSMAPEQWQGNPVPATDQYALAIMAYVLLTGKPPFNGRMEQLLLQHLSAPPAPPSTQNSEIPPDLDMVILSALNKEPNRRFGSITAFGRAFQQAGSGPGLALPQPLRSATPQFTPPRQENTPLTPAEVVRPAFSPQPQYPNAGEAVSRPPQPQYPAAGDSMPGIPVVPPYPVSGGSTPQIPIAPPPPLYPIVGASPLAPTIAPDSPTPLPSTPQQPMLLPMGPQPYGQGQSGGNFARPYEYPLTGSPQSLPGNTRPTRSNSLLWGIAAACLAVVLIIGGILGVNAYQAHQNDLNITSTQSAQNAQNTAIAQATLSIQGTQTAIAGRATADAQATVNAQASATAQTVANNPFPSYMLGSGKLTLLDPLSSTSNWQAASDTTFGGSCQFSGGAFHVSQTIAARFYYCQGNVAYGNFALEVQMRVVSGDCGGLVIREDGLKLYFFSVCANGNYAASKYVDSTGSHSIRLLSGHSNAITSNITLGMLANGPVMTLYSNQQKIGAINDNAFASGEIAFVAEDLTASTDVAYSNLRIWA